MHAQYTCIIDRLHGRKSLKPEYRARDVAALPEDFFLNSLQLTASCDACMIVV